MYMLRKRKGVVMSENATWSIKNDEWIRRMVDEKNMISPCERWQVRENGVISYGVTAFGYDMRLGNTLKVFNRRSKYGTDKAIDPKMLSDADYFDEISTDNAPVGSPLWLPPNSYALGYSVEYFKIPSNVMVLVIGKSTYARAGILINVTPGEPGWEGQWTIEIANLTPRHVKVYPNEGISQCVFFEGETPTTTYADKKGKYMYQTGITLPKVEWDSLKLEG